MYIYRLGGREPTAARQRAVPVVLLTSVKNTTASKNSRRSAKTIKLARSKGGSNPPASTSSSDGACPTMTVDDSSCSHDT